MDSKATHFRQSEVPAADETGGTGILERLCADIAYCLSGRDGAAKEEAPADDVARKRIAKKS
jgi:hypothetical protein